jgi:uncharacterized membrane protein YciS (DUF1049 family)
MMPWWAWILIAMTIAGIGYLKLKVWNSMTKKKAKKIENNED